MNPKTAELVEQLVEGVKSFMTRNLTPVVDRVKVLEERLQTLKEQPIIDVDAVARRAVELIPTPPPGRDGRDGVGRAGKDGKDGAAGKDGMSVDDFDLRFEDEGRSLIVALRCGDSVVEKRLTTGMPIYRGVFKTSGIYQRGDTVTYGGSLFIALRSTGRPPPSDGWQCAVSRGKDGKDLRH